MSIEAKLPRRPDHDAWCAPDFCSAYYEIRDKNYQILRRRGVPTSYLTLTLSGSGFVRDFSDHVYRLEPGHLCFIEAQSPQNYGIGPGARWFFHWVHFHTPSAWLPWLQALPSTGVHGVHALHIRDPEKLKGLSRSLFSLHDHMGTTALVSRPLDLALAMNVVERCLLLALKGSPPPSGPSDLRIQKVLALIQENPFQAHNLQELAAKAALSGSRLSHLFMEQTGESLGATLNRRRLAEAKTLLKDPVNSIQSIAERLRFSNAYSFSNWFLRSAGQRPGAFRNKNVYYYKRGIYAKEPSAKRRRALFRTG